MNRRCSSSGGGHKVEIVVVAPLASQGDVSFLPCVSLVTPVGDQLFQFRNQQPPPHSFVVVVVDLRLTLPLRELPLDGGKLIHNFFNCGAGAALEPVDVLSAVVFTVVFLSSVEEEGTALVTCHRFFLSSSVVPRLG